MPTQFYSLGGVLYQWQGANLVKAGKPSPGQMSLFDESQHPRAEDGKFTGKGEGEVKGVAPVVAQDLRELDHTIAASFTQKAQDFIESIGSMPMNELEDFDPEYVLNDELFIDAVDRFHEGGKHFGLDVEPDEIDERHAPALTAAYDQQLKASQDAIEQRIEEIDDRTEEIPTEAAGKLIEAYEALPDPDTVQEWQAMKEQIQSAAKQITDSYDSELENMGVEMDWSGFQDELAELLDQYSSDPEDWD